jgi:hypothetical protein
MAIDWLKDIPSYLTAIGTVGAVVWSMSSDKIRKKWNKPKIELQCDKTKDNIYLEIITEDENNFSNNSCRKIRFSIENKGRSVADKVSIFIDSYYIIKGDNKLEKKDNFTPIQIVDFEGECPTNIVPKLRYFYDFASIKKTDELADNDNEGKAEQFYRLFLYGKDTKKGITLDKGDYIFPIKFYSLQTKTNIFYIEIKWLKDDSLKIDDHNYFDFKILKEKDFKKYNTK